MLRNYAASFAGGMALGVGIGNVGAVITDRNFLKYFNFPSDERIESLAAISMAGGAVGAILAGWSSDCYGRKATTIVAGLLVMLGASMAMLPLIFQVEMVMIMFSRFLVGTGGGILFCSVPMYISETTSPAFRGAVGASFQMFICCGVLTAYVFNYFLLSSSQLAWTWSLALQLPWAVFLVASMLALPESPRWLLACGRQDDARTAFGQTYGACVNEEEFQSVSKSCQELFETSSTSNDSKLWHWNSKVAILVAMLQAACGIDIMVSYAPRIFAAALGDTGNATTKNSLYYTILSGIVITIACPISTMLMDKLGRRPLLLVGAAGNTLTYAVLGLGLGGWLDMVMCNAFLLFFGLGWGPIGVLLPSELAHSKVRSRVLAIGNVLNWMVVYCVVFSYLSLVNSVGRAGVFRFYAAVNASALIFAYLYVPETVGTMLDSEPEGQREGCAKTA
eukprot:TRINITY_DN102364_c0_g1_i1.p1 TRINITY_DN102364_c0_g1~~TRINITY_DN102364_c0_g1_i1.p1  ORF type:complete len:450 (+),score=54.83 TRINITY_DN102364_c0_g1_i1:88-1437(+)